MTTNMTQHDFLDRDEGKGGTGIRFQSGHSTGDRRSDFDPMRRMPTRAGVYLPPLHPFIFPKMSRISDTVPLGGLGGRVLL